MGKRKLLLVGLAVMVVFGATIGGAYYRVTFAPMEGAGQTELSGQIADIVTAYRKLIVLVESEASLDAEQQRRIPIVGRMIFHENQARLNNLTAQLVAETERVNVANTPLIDHFLKCVGY